MTTSIHDIARDITSNDDVMLAFLIMEGFGPDEDEPGQPSHYDVEPDLFDGRPDYDFIPHPQDEDYWTREDGS